MQLPGQGFTESLWVPLGWTLKEWWARPYEPEGRQGQGHGNLERKWVPECGWSPGLVRKFGPISQNQRT